MKAKITISDTEVENIILAWLRNSGYMPLECRITEIHAEYSWHPGLTVSFTDDPKTEGE